MKYLALLSFFADADTEFKQEERRQSKFNQTYLKLGITGYLKNIKTSQWSFQGLLDYFLLPWEAPVLGLRIFRTQQDIRTEIDKQKAINRYIIHRMSRFR